MIMPPPPLKSKHQSGPTQYELEYAVPTHLTCLLTSTRPRLTGLNAKLFAERKPGSEWQKLKLRPIEEQLAAAQRARAHQAAYRERHRNDLRVWEAQRRIAVYKAKFGVEAYAAYAKAKKERKRRAKEKRRATEERRRAKRAHCLGEADRKGRAADGVDGRR
ncbi:hypothetical protein B0H11DRAFT_2215008 [Mycena galericulata]|nr:hypothetical protein B0H11DRAFT_2233353 [Mycena galericulata]KAJ7511171.1 hypothetical protein B0H11DRAFT_2215008 [Mycena galericulata]